MTPQKSPGRTVVIGIGSGLRGDDGCGSAAVARWRQRRSRKRESEVQAICLEAPGLELLDQLEGARRAVLVDAVRSGAPAGTLHRIAPEDLAAFKTASHSAHGWGVGETLALAREVCPERLPEDLRIVGIEAGSLEPGGALSPAVASVLDDAADLVEACLSSDGDTAPTASA